MDDLVNDEGRRGRCAGCDVVHFDDVGGWDLRRCNAFFADVVGAESAFNEDFVQAALVGGAVAHDVLAARKDGWGEEDFIKRDVRSGEVKFTRTVPAFFGVDLLEDGFGDALSGAFVVVERKVKVVGLGLSGATGLNDGGFAEA